MLCSSGTTGNTVTSNNLKDRKCNQGICGFRVIFTFRMLKGSINLLKVIDNRSSGQDGGVGRNA